MFNQLTSLIPPKAVNQGLLPVTWSNIAQIDSGSKIIYLQAPGLTSQDSDIIVELPGPGNNRAFGHCFGAAAGQH